MQANSPHRVNRYYVANALLPLAPEDEQEQLRLRQIRGEDEAEVKAVIERLIKPWFDEYDAERQCIVKDSLRYYLSKTDGAYVDDPRNPESSWSMFTMLYNISEPELAPPTAPREFFVWLWEALFGDEQYHVSPGETYLEDSRYP